MSTDQAADMKPFRTATTLTISLTAGCIIRTVTIATAAIQSYNAKQDADVEVRQVKYLNIQKLRTILTYLGRFTMAFREL